MVFFALLSIKLVLERKIIKSFLSYVISIFVKFSTLFLIPVFLEIFLKNKKKDVNLGDVYYHAGILMFFIFLLSFFREIYPWYAIWFLPFSAIIPNKKILKYLSLSFSFGLLLSYIPYMYTGYYHPIIQNFIIFVPVVITVLFEFLNKTWLRELS